MRKYWDYFKYIVEHKKNVGIECLKAGMFIHAITHDLSKFLPSEFIPYAKFSMIKIEQKNIKYLMKMTAIFRKVGVYIKKETNIIGIIGLVLQEKMKLFQFLCLRNM